MSKEVGSGHVAIFPVFKGMRKAISKEVGDGVKDAEGTATRGMGQIGQSSGRALGRGLKTSLDASTGDLGTNALAGLQKNVAKASDVLSRARLRQQDDAGAVRVAETRLAEAIAKTGETSSQAVAAEERLAAARRRLSASTERVNTASTSLASAQGRLRSLQESLSASSLRHAGVTARLAASFPTLRKNVADLFAPVTTLGSAIGNLGSRVLRPVTSRIGAFASTLRTGISGAVKPAIASVRDFGLQLGYRVSSGVVTASNAIRSVLRPALQKITPLTTPIGRAFSGAFGLAKQAVSGLATVAGPVASAVAGAFSRAASGISEAFSGMARFAQGQFALVAAGAIATVGAALKGGFGRLSSIEDATARMRGLGLESDVVAGAMKTAEDAARGTAFGLDEMAAASAMALTSGVKPGAGLAAYLEAVKGAATASGASLADVALVFGNVRTAGRAYTQDINQIAAKNVPIWQALADEIGVSTDEVRNLATEGKITAETFETAVRNATGGMAAEVGETTASAFRNAGAALKRFGVALLGSRVEGDRIVGGLFPLFKQFANTIRAAFDAASTAIGPFMSAFTDGIANKIGPVLERMQSAFEAFKEAGKGLGSGIDLSGLGGAFGALLPAIGGVLGMVGPLLTKIPLLGGMFGGLTGPVGILAGALVALFTIDTDTLISGFDTIVTSLPGMVSGIADGLVSFATTVVPRLVETFAANAPVLIQGFADVLVSLVESVTTALPVIVQAIADMLPGFLQAIVGMIPALAQAVTTALPAIVTAIVGMLPGLAQALISMIPGLVQAAIDLFNSLVTALVTVLPDLITQILAMLPSLLESLLAMLPALLQGAIDLFLGIVTGLITAIPAVIEALVNMLPQLITAIAEMLPTLITAAIDLFLGLITGLLEAIPQLITALIGALPRITSALIGLIPRLIPAALQLFLGLVQGIVQAIPKITSALVAMAPELVGAIGQMGPQILAAGGALIQSFIDGIKGMFNKVGEVVGGFMDWVGGFFPHSPARRGPFSGAGWRRIAQGGASLAEQFASGIQSGAIGSALSAEIGALEANVSRASAPGGLSLDMPPVFVQNPFTGEYLLAEMDSVATSAAGTLVGAAMLPFRGGRRT